jgi:hypothetical protein
MRRRADPRADPRGAPGATLARLVGEGELPDRAEALVARWEKATSDASRDAP